MGQNFELVLEPIDPTRCQAEIKEGSFMTFGPRQYRRCENKPTFVAIDIQKGKFRGAMALCEKCALVCEIQVPTAKFQRLGGV